MTGAKVNFNFSGSVIFVPFSGSGNVTANVTVKNRVKFSSPTSGPQEGQLLFTVTTESVTISNVSVSISGVPAIITNVASDLVNTIFSGIIQNQLKALVQNVVSVAMDPFKYVTTVVNQVIEKTYQATKKIKSAVVHTVEGVTAYFQADIVPSGAATGPALPEYVSGAGTMSSFGATVPGTGATYHWGVAMKTDALNAMLAKLTSGGFMSGDYDSFATQLGLSFGAIPFTAAELSAWLPTAGFERLPASQIVKVVLDPKVAPVLKGDATDPKFGAEIAGMKAKFITKAPGSQIDIEYFRLELEFKLSLNVKKASKEKFEVEILSEEENSKISKSMPGAKKSAAAAGGKKFAEILTPIFLRGFGKLPLPGYSKSAAAPFSGQLKAAPLGGKAGLGSWNKFQNVPD
jgi:hypothetical protein